jgi:hypothetical protein
MVKRSDERLAMSDERGFRGFRVIRGFRGFRVFRGFRIIRKKREFPSRNSLSK